jgi:DNA-directed RNA polymerase specialized sigma24 family protein
VAPAGVARSPGDAAAIARLRGLASADRGALALTVLAAASLTEVAIVLDADRRAVGARLGTGLRTLDARREPAAP